ncbi:MAG: T9SS type A sorting domain-containing protein [Flavobacteriales bacterium]|nr:T9SS type A sorting domain-containing protein [Flavobacteriales bacterium]
MAAANGEVDPGVEAFARPGDLPGHTGAVYLVVRDAAGRVLHRYATSGQQGRHSWDTRGLAPGLYLVELHRDGGVERTERLVVQH